jgi:putative transposase
MRASTARGTTIALLTFFGDMARLPRLPVVGLTHHVTQRGNNRCAIFTGARDYAFFRQCLESAANRYACHVHAYVLMTNHVHLLVTPFEIGAIGKLMQSVGRRYVLAFNRSNSRTGTLWEGRYKATAIDTERYLFACYRYIEMNPVRAGLADDPRDYRWSSYRANALGWLDSIVMPHERFDALGADAGTRQRAYRGLFDIPVDEPTLQLIRAATKKGSVLGEDQFCRGLSAQKVVEPRHSPLTRE